MVFSQDFGGSVGNQYSREGQPVLFGFVIVVVLLLLLDKINLLFFVLEAPPGFPLENLSIIFFSSNSY